MRQDDNLVETTTTQENLVRICGDLDKENMCIFRRIKEENNRSLKQINMLHILKFQFVLF